VLVVGEIPETVGGIRVSATVASRIITKDLDQYINWNKVTPLKYISLL
jgi:hypothetical protein